MCVAVMKEMNYIFKEENVDAEIVLYEVFKNFNLICRKISSLFRFFQLIKPKV